MSTNYQARIKPSAEAKAGLIAGDTAALVPTLVSHTVKPVALATARGTSQKRIEHAVAEPAVVAPVRQHGAAPLALITYRVGKRAFDIVFGTTLLLIAVPIILIAAIAIRINTPGSPFFFQTRLGKHGIPFKIFKLRGMYIDARQRFPSYYDYSGKQDLEFCFHHEDDPRVTRAGRFIRKTSIDELPNLWNVVLGDMSLVGPRPEIPEVLALYGPYRDEYLSVKPGISCLSKCTGRDRLTKRETIECDLRYIHQRSFVFDMKILWQTFRAVVLRRDVF